MKNGLCWKSTLYNLQGLKWSIKNIVMIWNLSKTFDFQIVKMFSFLSSHLISASVHSKAIASTSNIQLLNFELYPNPLRVVPQRQCGAKAGAAQEGRGWSGGTGVRCGRKSCGDRISCGGRMSCGGRISCGARNSPGGGRISVKESTRLVEVEFSNICE